MPARDVFVFLCEGLSDWETGYALAGIGSPWLQNEPGRYRIRAFSSGGEAVTSMGGLRIQPDLALADVSPDGAAMLILPGGTSWETRGNADAAALAASFAAARVAVAAICGATAGLAKAGLLDNRPHTSNAREYLASTGYRGAALYRDDLAVDGGGVITASGAAALEFARLIFARLELYPPPVLEAWYGLFKTGRPEYFQVLAQAGGG